VHAQNKDKYAHVRKSSASFSDTSFPELKEKFSRKILQFQFEDEPFGEKREYKMRFAVNRAVYESDK
jgi:hypothetical protein